MRSRVFVELGNGWRHFEAEVEDLALALQANVFGPFDHAREVAARLDVGADAEVAGAFFDERVLLQANTSSVSMFGKGCLFSSRKTDENEGREGREKGRHIP